MKQIRHSRQRDAILLYLCSQNSHPTAEEIYEAVRKMIPNISLGTVYRNLAQLQQMGRIRAISNGTCAERFDGELSDHHHFICDSCGQVFDVYLEEDTSSKLDHVSIEGNISSYDIVFHGKCKNCAG